MSGGVGDKKRQTSFRLLRSLREVLTKRMSGAAAAAAAAGGGLTVVESQLIAVKAVSANNVMTDVQVPTASDNKSTNDT